MQTVKETLKWLIYTSGSALLFIFSIFFAFSLFN